MLASMLILIAGVGVMSTGAIPFEWQITDPFVMAPLLCVAIPHVLYIFILNRESMSVRRPRHRLSPWLTLQRLPLVRSAHLIRFRF
jgi:hypothetical protein